jgi:DNA-binding CsgD family transcriptional regulator
MRLITVTSLGAWQATRQCEKPSTEQLRDLRVAAKRVDRSPRRPAADASKDALEAWEGVLTGSSSMVDWFDTDTRRIVLVKAVPPGCRDPRRLTKRERDVARYAAAGETNKLIAHRLGTAPNCVSRHVQSVLRKLGLRNRAQLVYCVRGLGLPVAHGTEEVDLSALPKSA